MNDLIGSVLREYQRRETEAIEAAIEQMLVTPGPLGVRVYQWIDGMSAHFRVDLSPDVQPMIVTYIDGPPPAPAL